MLSLLTVPFAILNFFGVLGGAIWLAILGKWSLLGIGVACMFLSGLGLRVALIPGTLIGMIATPFFGRRFWFLGFPFILAGSIYSNAIIGIWCLLVVAFFVDHAGADATVPALLWAYGVAIAPLSYMTAKDSSASDGAGFGDVLITFCSQIAVVAMGVVVLTKGSDLHALIEACAGTMIIATVLHAIAAFLLMREASKEAAFAGEFRAS